MESKALSFWQATKVWWSFLWRTWVMMIPLMIVWLVGVYFTTRGMPSEYR